MESQDKSANENMPRTPSQLLCCAWRSRCYKYLLTPVSTLIASLQLKAWGAQVKRGLTVSGPLRVYNAGSLTIGRNVRMRSGAANFVGGGRKMAMWVGRMGRLAIEDRCALSNTTISCHRSITLLSDTFIGGGCEIYDNDFHQIDADDRIARRGDVPSGPVTIGPKAFVGAWSIILKNVTIGEGAVVGAGSVVTRSIPAYEIWAGVPARFVRKIDGPSQADRPQG